MALSEVLPEKISTEEDYEAVMAEIERLWDADGADSADTDIGKWLDKLVDLVEAYEKMQYPITD